MPAESVTRPLFTTVLGLPRIGRRRELKFAIERYWKGELSAAELEQSAAAIRAAGREACRQAGLAAVPTGDFSFYDQVLDLTVTLGNWPQRFRALADSGVTKLDLGFALARGAEGAGGQIRPLAMKKWFDTNYHYLVPEFAPGSLFTPDVERVLQPWREAREAGFVGRPVLLGPLSYLQLGVEAAGPGESAGAGTESARFDRFWLLPELVHAYTKILKALGEAGVDWVQLDEPILALDLEEARRRQFASVYGQLAAMAGRPKILLASYFGEFRENLDAVLSLPVDGLHLDAVRAGAELPAVVAGVAEHPQKILSLGVVDGRNIWRTDLVAASSRVRRAVETLGAGRVWLAGSCSLLHSPWSFAEENQLPESLRGQCAGVVEKLEELRRLSVLATAEGSPEAAQWLKEDRQAKQQRADFLAAAGPSPAREQGTLSTSRGAFAQRAAAQKQRLNLPPVPTTTIGSFPQTAEVRSLRAAWKKGELDDAGYRAALETATAACLREQEALGLDVLVHGEFERNDMVEYFGEQLDGIAFSRWGWVQSYGTRCVKPPIIHAPVRRPRPMTVDWARFAQAQSAKPVKGMLTGPVTILQWSFVREDQPRAETMDEVALAIRQEVTDLETAGIAIIQIDEAALREGLPLRRADWQEWLNQATRAFRLATSGVSEETQIHTHMCYSSFEDIAQAIVDLDADVITIEAARAEMGVLEGFRALGGYPNAMGPGLWDIHSPLVPSAEDQLRRLRKAALLIPVERLWANPDCGLKTRGWPETRAALANLVAATQQLREQLVANV